MILHRNLGNTIKFKTFLYSYYSGSLNSIVMRTIYICIYILEGTLYPPVLIIYIFLHIVSPVAGI